MKLDDMKRLFKQNAMIGVVLALSAHAIWYWVYAYMREAAPATDWFDVKILVVRDAVEGEDPMIVFDREIKRATLGTFTSVVYRHDGAKDSLGTVYCSGQGSAIYEPGRRLPPAANRLSWLMNRDEQPCRFGPGIYRNITIWTLTPEGYPTKQLARASNYFTIKPRETVQ